MNYRKVSTSGSCLLNFEDCIESKKKKDKNAKFLKQFCTFDIEVTNYVEGDIKAGIVYLWTFAYNTEDIIYGRTIEDFVPFISQLNKLLENEGVQLVIYVHNLAYEFQFIRTYFDWDEVYVLDNRRPLYCKTGNITFRCSYMLSNMSLDNFLKNNDCEILKLPYDYSVKRYPWSALSQEDLEYCAHDTAGLLEALQKIMEKDGEDITTIPLTSTGYVRRDIKNAETPAVKHKIKELAAVSPDLYYALNHAFVGGNTHANRYWVNQELTNVVCYDIASSYPYVQLTADYPITPFKEKTDGLNDIKLDAKFAYLLLITFKNIEIKPWDGMPNISLSKCLKSSNYTLDNGRILKAESITIWMTDIEFHITEKHYTFENMTVNRCYYSRYGQLPECIKSCIYTYFEQKCRLKKSDPYLYRKSKEKLNSIYGMSAFDIGKRRFSWEDNDYQKDGREESIILNEALKSTQAEPYIWGVWTTARARENLDEVIRAAGESFVYCDTDSVYSLDALDLSAINSRIEKSAADYKVDFEGKTYCIGRWEVDKECLEFKTLGAKKYCYRDSEGVHTVTAGVSKKAGVKDVSEYKEGHVFKDATNTAYYSDEAITVHPDGRALTIPTCVYIESNDYTLGITDNYRCLLYYLYHGEGDLIYYE